MSDLFSILEADHHGEQERRAGTRAVVAANHRVATKYKPFLEMAWDDQEFESRIAFLSENIREDVRTACTEYGTSDVDKVYRTVITTLHGKTACKSCGCDEGECKEGNCKCGNCASCGDKKEAAAHPEGCQCSFPVCVRKREGGGEEKSEESESEPESEESAPPWESESKESHRLAAPPNLGDSYWHSLEDLPSADASGLGSEGSPEITKSRVPASGLDAIDVPSKAHPSEMQTIGESGPQDRDPVPYQDGDRGSLTKAPTKQVDADEAMQLEHNVAPHTNTWSGESGQANPVTEKSSKWRVAG